MQQGNRQFAFSKAVRQQAPLLIGLVGPSGVGKTFSALRLARGIQRVTGGRVKGIDTEHKRMSHYSDDFDFDCMDFRGPFGSLDYLAAIQEAAKTPGPIIVDSLSHEHDGPGGYLDGLLVFLFVVIIQYQFNSVSILLLEFVCNSRGFSDTIFRMVQNTPFIIVSRFYTAKGFCNSCNSIIMSLDQFL